MQIRETAHAKVNLTLEVLGRRPDGYHELVSVVAFATVGDTLIYEPSGEPGLSIDGPFASDLTGENLIERARSMLEHAVPDLRTGAVKLAKRLPVASGIGGGSADAAAFLRAVARAEGAGAIDLASDEMMALAMRLGADVPACLGSRACVMRGIGAALSPLAEFPATPVILVNPRVAVETATVFAKLGAAPILQHSSPPASIAPPSSVQQVAALVRDIGNDLLQTAAAVAPVIEDVLEALGRTQHVLAASLSGSGATCFAIYETLADAERAAAELARAHRDDWWIATGTLR